MPSDNPTPDPDAPIRSARVVGYFVPEFPGQTHIWMWRELSHWRERGAPVQLFSTRRPPPQDRARHAFADPAEAETEYLWPQPWYRLPQALLWALLTRPLALLQVLALALRLPVTPGPAWRRNLPLVPLACILAQRALRAGVTHLHAQSARTCAVLAMMVKRLTGCTYSLVVNARLDEWGGALAHKFGEAEAVVTHAAWLRDEILREYTNLTPARVLLAPVGVDTRGWPARERYAHDPVLPFQVVSVGRLHRNKGHDTLIAALKLLLAEGRGIELRIAGDGPERPALEKRIVAEVMVERVTLLGSLDEEEVREALARADVFALPSRTEALGVVFMEALAAGLPAVGADVGGVGEIIRHDETGLLVPPDDPQALADALRRLMDDAALRERLGRAGRAFIEEHYDSRHGAARLAARLWPTA